MFGIFGWMLGGLGLMLVLLFIVSSGRLNRHYDQGLEQLSKKV